MTGEGMISTGRDEWRRGWSILAVTTYLYGCNVINTMVVGTFIRPLQAAFGWSRGEITGVMMFAGVFSLVLNPFLGLWVIRRGGREVGLIGLAGLAVGTACVGLSGPDIRSWYVAWAFLSLFIPMTNGLIWSTPVVRIYKLNRGLALSIMSSAGGVVAIIAPMMAVACVQMWGWRSFYFLLAAIFLFVSWPITWKFFVDDGDEGASTRIEAAHEATGPPPKRMGVTLRQAMRTRRYWQIGAALVIASLAVASLVIHMQPMLIDAGISPQGAAAMMSALGVSMFVGRLIIGFLLDRLSGPLVGGVAMLLPVFGTLIMLNYDGSIAMGVMAAVCIGVSQGGEYDLLAYFVSRYFGTRNYSAIFGSLVGMYSMGYAVAPVIAGLMFDAVHSYTVFLRAATILSILSAILIATLGKYPYSAEES